MRWEWNKRTGIGTGLAGSGVLVAASGRSRFSTLLGLAMLAGGGYLVYDGLAGKKAPPKPSPPGKLTKPSVRVEVEKGE